MQFVKLVVPKHLSDELNLHPLQTITLSNSGVLCNPGTRFTNVNTALNSEETPNQHHTHKPLSVEPPINQDWRADKSLQENSGSSILTLVVNVGNGMQKILTYHLISIRIVSIDSSGGRTDNPENVFSNSYNTGPSVTDLNSAIHEHRIPENFVSTCSEREGTSIEHDVHFYNDNSSKPLSQQRELNLLCDEPLVSESVDGESTVENLDASFAADANSVTGKREILPYSVNSTSRVSNEQGELESTTKKYSEGLNMQTGENYSIISGHFVLNIPESNNSLPDISPSNDSINVLQGIPVEGGTINFMNRRVEPQDDTVYPRTCLKCNQTCSSRDSFRNHLKKCTFKKGKEKKITYPRGCVKCKKLYSSKQSFSTHKKRCGKVKPKSGLSNKGDLILKQVPRKVKISRMCPVCGHSFRTKIGFNKHEHKCFKKKPYEDSDSSAEKVLKKPGEWIPIQIDSKKVKYFVAKKDGPNLV